MEQRLQESSQKSGWNKMTDADLIQRIHDELGELSASLVGENGMLNSTNIIHEASDVGNFLAFLAWKYRTSEDDNA